VPIYERYEQVLSESQLKKSQRAAVIVEEAIKKDPERYSPSFRTQTSRPN
jgi:hypothetical protein